MKGFIDFINIPRSIIRYRKRKLIEKFSGEKQNKIERNYLIIWFCIVFVSVINYFFQSKIILISSLVFLIIFILILKISEKKNSWIFSNNKESISKAILKDEEGKNIKIWNLNEKSSFLIGKKTKSNEVDIDLGQDIYASLISREHGILNFAGNKWYFEDIGSSNGSGIKRRKDEKKFKVEEGKSYPMKSGDIIYIANTKLILK